MKHLVQTESLNEELSSTENYFRDSEPKPMDKSKNLSYSNVTSVSVPCVNKDSFVKSSDFINKFDFMCLKILNILEVIEYVKLIKYFDFSQFQTYSAL